MDSRNVVLPSDPVSVPADHQDPNHPHYPGDLEHQSWSRRSVITKKRVLIAAGVITTILVIITTTTWRVALTRKHDNKAAAAPSATATLNTATSAPLEIHTVSLNAITIIYSTTRMPLLIAPPLATSTVILATPRTPDAPLRPVATKTVFATSAPSAPVSSAKVPVDDISITGCFFNGAWVSKEQCQKHCPT